jgi:hypothetical protein
MKLQNAHAGMGHSTTFVQDKSTAVQFLVLSTIYPKNITHY